MKDEDEPDTISRRVIEAVADETGTDPLELDPLYRVVDPDSLDEMFRGAPPAAGRGAYRIEFTFGGCRVTVTGDETVTVSSVGGETTTSVRDGRSAGSSGASGSPD